MSEPELQGYVPLAFTSDWYADVFETPTDPVALADLADGDAVQSPSLQLTFANNFFSQQSQEYHVHAKLQTVGTGDTTSDRGCYLYAIAADRAGLAGWPEGGSSSGGPITLNSPTNAIRLGFVSMPENGVSYSAGPFSLAQAFGGIVPQEFAIVVENRTGSALSDTEADLKVSIQAYRLIYFDFATWVAFGLGGGGGGGEESA